MIIREFPKVEPVYPPKKEAIRKNYTICRYTASHFDEYNKITPEIRKNYMSLSKGFNLETNKKVQVNSVVHKRLMMRYRINNELFIYMDNINREEYEEETRRLEQKSEDEYIAEQQHIDAEYAIIKAKIDAECDYKTNILRTRILDLRWEESIEFDGKRYGIPRVLGNIHRENNCKGILKRIELIGEDTNITCENWLKTEEAKTTDVYFWKCSKCNTKI